MAKAEIHVPPPKDPEHDVFGYSNEHDDLATIVGQALPPVMRDASNMPQLIVAVDAYLKRLPPDVARAKKQLILEQLQRGQKALESAQQRIGFSIG